MTSKDHEKAHMEKDGASSTWKEPVAIVGMGWFLSNFNNILPLCTEDLLN